MIRFFDGKEEIDMPTMLEELSPEQYKYLIMLSTIYLSTRVMTEDAMRERWVAYLCGLGNIDISLLTSERQQYYRNIIHHTDGFFYRDSEGRSAPHFDTTVNLLPECEGYKGPESWLDGMTFGEFTKCLTLLDGVEHSVNNEETSKANEEIFEEVARVMYKIPEGKPVPEILLFHAPKFFWNVLRKIEGEPIPINGKMIDFRIIFKPSAGGTKADDHTGWTGISFEVASSGIFGDLKGVESTDFWAVLLYLYRCKFEYLHSKK